MGVGSAHDFGVCLAGFAVPIRRLFRPGLDGADRGEQSVNIENDDDDVSAARFSREMRDLRHC